MPTKYPIILVHGLFGFDKIAGYPCFFAIENRLKKQGYNVFSPILSGVNSNEVNGEQLWLYIEELKRNIGCEKVNLIAHSQGALFARYVAANYSASIASVTSMNGVNHGSEIADLVRKVLIPGKLTETVVVTAAEIFFTFISLISSGTLKPQDGVEALNSLTTEVVNEFNKKYPQGLPKEWRGEGDEVVNGVHYYSFGSFIKKSLINSGINAFDVSHTSLLQLSSFFSREKENDGLVGRYSMRLGKLICDDYDMDHLDIVNQIAGVVSNQYDIPSIYVNHAQMLAKKGL
ncbi:triacylglycerol lipase [Arsenophonus nasoniae]|uniref:Lipase n=1 Tax=Arsenophonus nasoniae TaxID=638 RepID=D2TW31_9GAMM|nr:triacylglycerol lipase [Arsenophonus nasoniae]QBY44985.1 Lactonizing lipase [Arsenophonus nasoniae]WGL94683.1 triacylglycerol lipase [Arsenophonus nasoniae]WGM01122.1 triacylglycerol lipase [Arsenophonus nasoniae]WGM05214.1 triacylglycerol lipase [Arsenophonus nasoniae]WGM10224.1 triacylglycerol lipase [Arsenophonus nasoniae]